MGKLFLTKAKELWAGLSKTNKILILVISIITFIATLN
jgi:hypothetical protein